jgi:hypothetical protein
MKINGCRKEIDDEWKLHDAREGMDLFSLMFVDVHCRKPCALCSRAYYAPPLSGCDCQQRESIAIGHSLSAFICVLKEDSLNRVNDC